MADKKHQSAFPIAPAANGYARSDAEPGAAAAHDAGELRKKKRNKIILYIVLFAIFQTGIILIFSLTVMKFRTPKFRVGSAALTNLTVGTQANPSFSATMNAELAVRNTNFGRYKYQNTTVEILYGGASAGRAIVRGSSANLRSTKKFKIVVDLNPGANAQLASDLSAGILPLTIKAKMRGRVELFFVMKKKKSTDMNCSMDIVVATQHIKNIVCK